MLDQTTFERRLADAYERFLAGAPIEVDPVAIANAAVTRPWMGMPIRWSGRRARLVRIALVAALLAAFAASALWIVGHMVPAPRQNGPIILQQGGAVMSVASDGVPKALPLAPLVSGSCVAISPDGRWLAYLAESGATDELAITRLDGTDRRSLWTGAFKDRSFHQVVWAPDSTSVLATRVDIGGIVIGRLDARPAAELDWGDGEFPGTISLSPDGLRVAQIEGSSIVIHEVDGGPGTTITGVSGIGQLIAWSPDGSAIAYAASSVEGSSTVHVVGADGTAPRVVSTSAPDASIVLIAWSADGRRLAVVESTTIAGPLQSMLVTSSIVDGNGAVVGHVAPFEATGQTLLFTWSPDGKELLYSIGGGPDGQNPLIVAVDDGATRVIEMRTYFYSACAPGWGPVVP